MVFEIRNSLDLLQSTFIQRDITSDYDIVKELGKGSFSVVNECIKKSTGESFAVKTISKQKCCEAKHLLNEIKILQNSKHRNIISMVEVYETDLNLYLVMEICRGGELFDRVLESGPLTEANTHKIFFQLLAAVKHLHSKNIAHRDLKLENMLVTDDMKLKLTDFGLSRMVVSEEDIMKTSCGTPVYVAPEVLMAESYGPEVDIWSMGVCLFLMVFGEYPFVSDDIGNIYEKIISGKFIFPSDTSEEFENLVKGLLTVDVSRRLTLEEIENHPWMLKCAFSNISLSRSGRTASAVMAEKNNTILNGLHIC